ncbi:hypothetical protein QUF61_00460 [Candidatus Venteria ishoeyi]|nr:hypothetical protein [Candidatus Venteria ishoeyi]MDM8544941.1 hypothetical protein [Candidatus Venteria ishoeyi]
MALATAVIFAKQIGVMLTDVFDVAVETLNFSSLWLGSSGLGVLIC